MAGSRGSFIPVPRDVSNPETLYRFLEKLIEQLDIAFGVRGNSAFLPQSAYDSANTAAAKAAVASGNSATLNSSDYSDGTITGLLSKVDAALLYARADGNKELSGGQSYNEDVSLTEGYNLVHKRYVDSADATKMNLDGATQALGVFRYAYTVTINTDRDMIHRGYADGAYIKLDGSNSPTAPIDYAADYSGTYTDRSMTDKGYVLGAKTYTAIQTYNADYSSSFVSNDLVSKAYVDNVLNAYATYMQAYLQGFFYTAAQTNTAINNAVSFAVGTHAAQTSGVHGL